jgi:two-component system phosphate regulon response regulator OmpR
LKTKAKILTIDDDEKLTELLKNYLARFNYEVIISNHPLEGLNKLKSELPDIIILDVMLPDMEGFEVLKEIRKYSSTPVIMLTARGEVSDRIVGLEMGADDYLPKPFEPRELVARIQTVLRRGKTKDSKEVDKFGDLLIDYAKQSVMLNNNNLDLTTAEFELLRFFVLKAGKVLNRDEILDNMRGLEWDVFNRSIDVLISRLRQKLQDDPKHPKYIKTVWGSGYIFIGDEISE